MCKINLSTVIFGLLMAICLLIPATNTEAKATINNTTITLSEGQTCKLKVTGTKKKVIWKSNKKSIAKVNKNGKVTALKAGTCKIKAKVGKKTLTCKVKVKHIHSYTAKTINMCNCYKNGLVRWTCEKCGYSFDEVTLAGHDYVNGVCIICGAKEK